MGAFEEVVSNDSCSQATPTNDQVEYEGYDGWYNNLAAPSLGAVDTPLFRILPTVYNDSTFQPVFRSVNPIEVSRRLMNVTNQKCSKIGRTAFLVFFGQQVVEEILDAQRPACPPEYFNIDIPEDHEYYHQHPQLRVLPVLRTRFDASTGTSPNNPRQQLNEITPYIDGGLVYGTAKGWGDIVRTFHNGTLAPHGQLAWDTELGSGFPERNLDRLPEANPPPPTLHDDIINRGFGEKVDRFFKLGNPRGNENPFLLTFGILWYRWHNAIARYLHGANPSWNDERLFNEARKWVIACQQTIVAYDWLPQYLGSDLNPYESVAGKSGYDPSINPQISHAFQAAAMRFGHTLVTSGVYLRQRDQDGCDSEPFSIHPAPGLGGHTSAGVRTCNSFFRSTELFNETDNFEKFIMGMSSQVCEGEDNEIVEDLRGRLFGPLEFSRRDLMAINIQRGRDHGLPDYNTARRFFGLEELISLDFDEFKNKTNTDVPENIINELRELYLTPDMVDIWPGGLLETTNNPGQLFTAIMKDQFHRIRNGDRFWFENENNKLFTKSEIERLRQMKIIDIIFAVSDITINDIQLNPFQAININNPIPGINCLNKLREVNCSMDIANGTSYRSLEPLGNDNLEPCSPPQTFDYFTGSSVSFILTFLFTALSCVGIYSMVNAWSFFLYLQKRKDKGSIQVKKGSYKFRERVTTFQSRVAILYLDNENKRFVVENMFGKTLRLIDMHNLDEIRLSYLSTFTSLRVRVANHYDLFMMLDDTYDGKHLFEELKKFCAAVQMDLILEEISSYSELVKSTINVKHREKELTQFTNYVLDRVFDKDDLNETKFKFGYNKTKQDFFNLNLTQAELADSFGMGMDSLFLTQLFQIMDSDNSGFISISEFLHVMLIFNKGSIEEKARLYFNIYDLDQSGYLTSDDFYQIVKSNLGSEIKEMELFDVVNNMLASIGLQPTGNLTFEQFLEVIKKEKTFIDAFGINVENESRKGNNRFSIYGHLSKGTEKADDGNMDGNDFAQENLAENDSPQQSIYRQFSNYVRSKDKVVFWGSLYTIVLLLIFAERAYYYSVEREHAGLRRIAGYGVTVTRGAASAMMFTYSTILITMCRNTLSALRSSPLHKYFPFDDMVEFHKYIGWWALFWTIVHVCGHAINFYHISTQTASDLSCIFRDFFRSTHIFPKFHYWCWETVTGFTGIFLTIHIALIYTFAVSARKHIFKWFWITHNTYPLFYLLMIVHGSGNLVQPPLFHYFFLFPIVLFVFDKFISISRNSVEIDVVRATHLPSQVTLLHIRRPQNFSFQSGQWIRMASTYISMQEFHPFTLSSAPHETYLTLHIRGVGPWTNRLRKVYPNYNDIKNDCNFQYPKILLDGPFGEGHQNWWDYQVVVFVGGGIGVTPFSSILKDIVFKSKQPYSTFKCKRVLFLWVTRSQKQFEWLSNILGQVEETDLLDIIRVHIFITQFKSKYDMRTILLYMAERHFQKISGKSMFTGLKGITHFSRPDFPAVFRAIKKRYNDINVVGVFTCGNPSLSSAVEEGCRKENKNDGPVLKHYYENF